MEKTDDTLKKRVKKCKGKLNELGVKSARHYFVRKYPKYNEKNRPMRLDNLWYGKVLDKEFTIKLESFVKYQKCLLNMKQTEVFYNEENLTIHYGYTEATQGDGHSEAPTQPHLRVWEIYEDGEDVGRFFNETDYQNIENIIFQKIEDE